jgi:fermentation-respiration switch protein FrsA (DUF1100 family)
MPLLRLTFVAFLLLAAASGCGSLGSLSPLRPLEQALVFHPKVYPEGNWRPANLQAEDAWFEADDHTQLHGWFVDHQNPRGVALVCHGNAGNITGMADSLRALNQRHRLAVMTFDYRGYGRSHGRPSVPGILQDARAARVWLAARTGVAESGIILMGHSLGGGVAIDLASHDGARALVLSSTFTSLADVGASHAPWLLPHWNMTMDMNSLEKIPNYHGPLLISHGAADETIPFEQGQKLFAAARDPKQFIREPGGHNDDRTEAYRARLDEFLESLGKNDGTVVPAVELQQDANSS